MLSESGKSKQQLDKTFILRKLTNSFHGLTEDLSIMFGIEVDERSHAASVRLWKESNADVLGY